MVPFNYVSLTLHFSDRPSINILTFESIPWTVFNILEIEALHHLYNWVMQKTKKCNNRIIMTLSCSHEWKEVKPPLPCMMIDSNPRSLIIIISYSSQSNSILLMTNIVQPSCKKHQGNYSYNFQDQQSRISHTV